MSKKKKKHKSDKEMITTSQNKMNAKGNTNLLENVSDGNIDKKTVFKAIEDEGSFSIRECNINVTNPIKYSKLELNSFQKAQITQLLQYTPQAISSGILANAYRVSFPKGLPHTLTALNQGGYGSMVKANGRFAGSASFYPLRATGIVMGVFTALSAVTGQYYLSNINNNLATINTKLDDIIRFLYEDKKSEMVAEIEFVKYAFDNYSSIIINDCQRNATLIQIQSSKKIAIKDVEFYATELDDKSDLSGDYHSHIKSVNEGVSTIELLCAALKLYIMSSILEVYYSQNFDEAFLNYVENDLINYVSRVEEKVIAIIDYYIDGLENYDKKNVKEFFTITTALAKKNIIRLRGIREHYSNAANSKYKKMIHEGFDLLKTKQHMIIDRDGNVYIESIKR